MSYRWENADQDEKEEEETMSYTNDPSRYCCNCRHCYHGYCDYVEHDVNPYGSCREFEED